MTEDEALDRATEAIEMVVAAMQADESGEGDWMDSVMFGVLTSLGAIHALWTLPTDGGAVFSVRQLAEDGAAVLNARVAARGRT